jgi:hypothetical protein
MSEEKPREPIGRIQPGGNKGRVVSGPGGLSFTVSVPDLDARRAEAEHRRDGETPATEAAPAREPFYSPTLVPPQRVETPGDRLWTLTKGGRTRYAELRDHGEWGVEFQLFADGEFLYGRRCASRDLAVALVEAERAQRLNDGWTQAE